MEILDIKQKNFFLKKKKKKAEEFRVDVLQQV